jgi:enoyl-CoA hydratase/carnithine racemase
MSPDRREKMQPAASWLLRDEKSESMLAIERTGRTLVATLSRPPVNALDGELIARLDAVLDQVTADPEITVLHLRSDEKAFCAGADLALMQSCFATPEGLDRMVDVVKRMQHLFARIESAAVVTVAEIGGAAMGGGLELALACDLRVAALEAKLGLPEVRLGLLPAAGGTQRLTRLCGQGIAKRLILGAELIDGAEALRLGIIQWAQPREQLAGWTRELVVRIAGMPKAALAACKRCINAAGEPSRDGYAEEIAATRSLYEQPETRTKVSEFLTKNAVRTQTKEMP